MGTINPYVQHEAAPARIPLIKANVLVFCSDSLSPTRILNEIFPFVYNYYAPTPTTVPAKSS